MPEHHAQKIEALRSRLVNMAAVARFFTPVIESAAHFGLLPKAWHPMCKLSEELHNIPGSTKNKAMQAAQESKKLALAAKRFAIFAAKDSESEKAAAATILRLHFEVKAAAAAEHLATTLIPSNFKAAAHASYLKGRLDETIKTLKGITSTNNNGCLVTNTVDKTTRTSGNLGTEACRLAPPDTEAAEHTSAELTATGYVKLQSGSSGFQADANRAYKLLTGDFTNGVGTTTAAAAFTP
ncbi:Trypanosome variant surface glycoprotein (A-type) [Trypanosoma brucei equiperdum]|uniref:Trypanosome variant surface glycoprotein (A-type) n=1 Tax=Trypanosoma brucei equiperdum TaxID=630700 RepID=A0A3L6L9S0_9TRYP|nr:Trypanosome variant surface glycoprotein (A-type) [Trypanosoma brucei equiperdum]RHW73395.1 Trypanosome variant surface glycoprotein (A-type) [Trypanosoma brucei equiperdum]RHW73499.1 Trypanosome variant surface glycoprotein (A-type) [Trypanosoma brucei equiperdum]RHW73902.1 Trypanosome variant surface glycoprotein (A-type) [Trypanosoma brucei equiperdum]